MFFSVVAPDLTVTKSVNANGILNGFDFIAEAGRNYGSRYGVFNENSIPSDSRRLCESGEEYGSGKMSPLNNYAVLFNCL